MFTTHNAAESYAYIKSRANDAFALIREIQPQLDSTRRSNTMNWDGEAELYGVFASFSNADGVLWVHGDIYHSGTVSDFLAYILRKFW